MSIGTKWQVIEDNEWDYAVNNFNAAPYKQFSAWSLVQKELGWYVLKCGFFCKGKITLAQIVYRIYPFGFVVALCQGGPIGDLSKIDRDFFNFVKDTINSKYLYIRIRLHKKHNILDHVNLLKCGWVKPSFLYSKGWSMYMSLQSEWRGNLNRSWKRSLGKFDSDKYNIKMDSNPSEAEIYDLYKKMETNKGISQQFSMVEIKSILKYFKNNLLLFKGVDNFGNIVSIRGAIVIRKYAWDIFSATSIEGRHTGISHKVFFDLLSYCQSINVDLYDLSGIDPINNAGVYSFKKGVGAKHIEYLGEYEMSSNLFIKIVVNLILRLRKN